MGQYYEAVIDVTVHGKKFNSGEKITEKMSAANVSFLLDGGYIKKLPSPTKKQDGKQTSPSKVAPLETKADVEK